MSLYIKKHSNLNKSKNLFSTLIISVIFYIFYLALSDLIDIPDQKYLIFLFSWIGIVIYIYIGYSWKETTGSIFTPYMIFLTFFFLFNFGQPLMWALGIHLPNEIGAFSIYTGYDVTAIKDIVASQMTVIMSAILFHLGALATTIKIDKNKNAKKSCLDKNEFFEDKFMLKTIFHISILIGIIAIPITLINAFVDLQIAKTFGYRALYYSEYARSGFAYSTFISFWFFPSLIGMLIGSKFNKSIRFVIYTIFGLYTVLNILAGNRGPWILKLTILIWISHVSYKPIKKKQLIMYSTLSIIGIYIMDAIVSLRNVGITYDSVIGLLSITNSSVIKAFFELGSSMKPLVFLQMYGWDIWPYGNTYLIAIGGLITNKFLDVLGVQYAVVGNFFKDYLGLGYGPGFSIVAESVVNFGPLLAPVFMIPLGCWLSLLLKTDKTEVYTQKPLKFLFISGTLDALIPINRNGIHVYLKEWFYGVVVLCLLIYFINQFRILKYKQ